MNVTLVEINIKPERVDEFLEVFRANHEGAIQEPGNLRFDVLQDPRVKTRFFIYEAYKDEEAVLAHKHVVINDTLQQVEQFDDPWVQAYFHGPRGRAASRAAAHPPPFSENPCWKPEPAMF